MRAGYAACAACGAPSAFRCSKCTSRTRSPAPPPNAPAPASAPPGFLVGVDRHHETKAEHVARECRALEHSRSTLPTAYRLRAYAATHTHPKRKTRRQSHRLLLARVPVRRLERARARVRGPGPGPGPGPARLERRRADGDAVQTARQAPGAVGGHGGRFRDGAFAARPGDTARHTCRGRVFARRRYLREPYACVTREGHALAPAPAGVDDATRRARFGTASFGTASRVFRFAAAAESRPEQTRLARRATARTQAPPRHHPRHPRLARHPPDIRDGLATAPRRAGSRRATRDRRFARPRRPRRRRRRSRASRAPRFPPRRGRRPAARRSRPRRRRRRRSADRARARRRASPRPCARCAAARNERSRRSRG